VGVGVTEGVGVGATEGVGVGVTEGAVVVVGMLHFSSSALFIRDS